MAEAECVKFSTFLSLFHKFSEFPFFFFPPTMAQRGSSGKGLTKEEAKAAKEKTTSLPASWRLGGISTQKYTSLPASWRQRGLSTQYFNNRMKSRGRSPAPHSRPRDGASGGRGGSQGPGPGSTYSSEADDSAVNLQVEEPHDRLRATSSNNSPSHTLETGESLSNSIWYDEFDSTGLDPVAKQKALDQFQAKMERTKQQIKEEQNSRDENVDEYLRLSSCADRQQLSRIKQVFEKKNQKSAQSIAQLQKKLETYQRKVRDIEHGTIPHNKQPKEVLKDVGKGIKSGVVGTLNKPREFAQVIKNKFGSADNIPREEASSWGEGGEEASTSHLHTPSHHGHKRTQSGTVGGFGGTTTTAASRFSSQHTTNSLPRDSSAGGSVANSERRQSSFEEPASERSSVTSESGGGEEGGGNRWPEGGGSEAGKPEMLSPRHLGGLVGSKLGLESLMAEIHENREECDRLTGMLELQKQHFKQELEYLGGQLREESIRCDRLEEQMNDLTELHQNEMELVKSGVTDMEEKVQYQSEERIRDIQDQLATLQTGISRMEHQQAQHHQLAALEGFENSNARALVVKGINVLLTLLQVVLLLLATSAQILKPFLRTPTRVVTTVLLVTVLVLAIRQWTEIKEFSLQFATKMKNEKKGKLDL